MRGSEHGGGPHSGYLMMVGDLGMRVREGIQRYGKERIFSTSGGGGKGMRKFPFKLISANALL